MSKIGSFINTVAMDFADVSILAAEVTPTSILVRWTPPEVILNPTIQSRSQTLNTTYLGPCQRDQVAVPSRQMVVGEEVRMMLLDGLESSSDYAVTVTAEYPSDTVSGTRIITTESARM